MLASLSTLSKVQILFHTSTQSYTKILEFVKLSQNKITILYNIIQHKLWLIDICKTKSHSVQFQTTRNLDNPSQIMFM